MLHTDHGETTSKGLSAVPTQIHTPAELVAVVPHLLGFEPHDSLVVVPTGSGMPVARVDLPTSVEDAARVAHTLVDAYRDQPGPVVLVAFTADDAAAREALDAVADRGRGVLRVVDSLHVHGDLWTSLTGAGEGLVPAEARSRFAAEAVAAGRVLPAKSRTSIAAQLHGGDVAPVAAQLPAARTHIHALADDEAALMGEESWINARIGRFVGDHIPLSDTEAARMLADMETLPLRDSAWSAMRQAEAQAHVSLWTDLTRRAPEDAKTPAASLLAFAAWLSGDGARAWIALDQIPQQQKHHALAGLVTTALITATPPDIWEQTTGAFHHHTDTAGESSPHGPQHHRDLPPSEPPNPSPRSIR